MHKYFMTVLKISKLQGFILQTICMQAWLDGKKFLAIPGLEIKKIPKSPFGDQLEKYSRQMQIFSHQFV